MKKIVILLFFSLSFLLTSIDVRADGLISVPEVTYGDAAGGNAMRDLSNKVKEMAESINDASSQMMNFASMLYCNSLHGKAADWEFDIAGWQITYRIISIELWISSIILTIIGFFVLVSASFYMFDVAFNLAISITLLPLGIALWPFGWTRGKLKDVISNIAYYTGLFIFLPLGITIANAIILDAAGSAFGGVEELYDAFKNDQADLIEEYLAFYKLPFLKVLLCYALALKIIPLLAGEFCEHFFSGALAGSPMSEKITQKLSKLKQKTLGRAGKYGKDALKHQAGNAIKKLGDKNGNFVQRATYNFGKGLGKTK